jgi:hypothetical protein
MIKLDLHFGDARERRPGWDQAEKGCTRNARSMTEYEIVSGFGLDPARAGGARERPDASSGVPVLKENGSAVAGSAKRQPSSDSGIVNRASIIDIVLLPRNAALVAADECLWDKRP